MKFLVLNLLVYLVLLGVTRFFSWAANEFSQEFDFENAQLGRRLARFFSIPTALACAVLIVHALYLVLRWVFS
jgi:hypothetical protein